MKPIPTKDQIQAAIKAAALGYGLDPEIMEKQCIAESSMNPCAPHSKTGAVGLFQLMPATAKWLGVDPTDWKANIAGAARLDSILLKQFGTWDKALAAYNWGSGHLDRCIKQYASAGGYGSQPLSGHELVPHIESNGDSWRKHLPHETASYLDKILGPAVPA